MHMQARLEKQYLELVLRCPEGMEERLVNDILQYNQWVELQEKMQGTLLLKPEWLN